MAACGVSFGLCVIRATELDEDGNVAPGPGNVYVSDKPVTMGFNPNYDEGEVFTSRNGCGCSTAKVKSPDVFNWFEFTFAEEALEPELEGMMLGDTVIVDGADIVGVNGTGMSIDCSEAETTVAFEFWTKHYVGSSPDADHPWVHWIFPRSRWRRGDNTVEEGLLQPAFVGQSRTNLLWGSGPYGDGPPDGQDVTEFAWFKTAVAPPTATCAATDVEPGS
jgi:hypothetical protein